MTATTCPRILTRTYSATDLCGAVVSCQQIITINDITPPVISCPDTLFLDEGDPIPAVFTTLTTFRADGGIATDNCSLVDESFNLVFSDTIDARLSITILRDYTVADSCDNNDICRHVIFIKKDAHMVIACPDTISVACFNDIPLRFSDGASGYADWIAAGGSAYSLCGINKGSFNLKQETSVSNCPRFIIRTLRIEGLLRKCPHLPARNQSR